MKWHTKTQRLIIYTDGACQPNPGVGGWAAILVFGNSEKEISGWEKQTTNNRMELRAAIEALRVLRRPCAISLYTDSHYLKDGMTKRMPSWVSNNWKLPDGLPVKNQDLWEELQFLGRIHFIKWIPVKAHAKIPLNERVHNLAYSAMKQSSVGENSLDQTN